jgi:hypothetical protein
MQFTAYLCLLCLPVVLCSIRSLNVSCRLLIPRANVSVFFDSINHREVLSERKFLALCHIVQSYRSRRLHPGISSSLFAFLQVISKAI